MALFSASNASGTYDLWRTDGTVNGTTLLSAGFKYSLLPANSDHSTYALLGNGQLVFVGETAATGTELFVTDGTVAGTSLLKDIYPGSSGYVYSVMSLGNGQAVFSAVALDRSRPGVVGD